MKSRITAVLVAGAALCGCGSRAPEAVQAVVEVKAARPHHELTVVTVDASGSVVSPENPSMLAFLVAGKVSRVMPREGDPVRRGEVLATLDPADYELAVRAAEGQVAAARATVEKAESPVRPEVLEQARVAAERAQDEHQRMKQLYDSKSLAANDYNKFRAAAEAARQQYEQARAGGQKEDRAAARAALAQAQAGLDIARKHLADSRLAAPMDGFVASRSVEVGDVVSAGRPAFAIVQLDPVEISIGIPESDIGRVKVGQAADVRIPALGSTVYSGRVKVINVAADPASRTYMVRLTVPNPKRQLRLGMIAEVQIRGSEHADTLTVPGTAVLHDGQGASIVYVYYPDAKRAYARKVDVGPVLGSELAIRGGLKDADLVVVGGQQKLRDGVAVNAAIDGGAR
jgi:multidrug efflux pump subunit AcrA (membrane-fusion protein)